MSVLDEHSRRMQDGCQVRVHPPLAVELHCLETQSEYHPRCGLNSMFVLHQQLMQAELF